MGIDFEKMYFMHSIWYDFCDNFGDGKNSDSDSFKKLVGYEKMLKIEEWAKKFPEVKICYCDDNHSASSMLVIIPHPTYGITTIYVPQLTYDKDYFFLNPTRLKEYINALQSIEIEKNDDENLGFKDFVKKSKR